jgi:hypothetical protein
MRAGKVGVRTKVVTATSAIGGGIISLKQSIFIMISIKKYVAQ